jgi:hypothetical protein
MKRETAAGRLTEGDFGRKLIEHNFARSIDRVRENSKRGGDRPDELISHATYVSGWCVIERGNERTKHSLALDVLIRMHDKDKMSRMHDA